MAHGQSTNSSRCPQAGDVHMCAVPTPSAYCTTTSERLGFGSFSTSNSRCRSWLHNSSSKQCVPELPVMHGMQPWAAADAVCQVHRAFGTPAFIPSVAEPAAAAFTRPSLDSSSSNSVSTRPGPSTSSGSSSPSDVASRSSTASSNSVSSSTNGTSSNSSSSSSSHEQHRSVGDVLRSAGVKGLGGGLPGAAAMVVQVLSLMWLRTTVNYQYRFGTSTGVALRTLYADGGIRRFYRGVGFAVLQGPLCRFGDTAANAGMLSVMAEYEATRSLPLGVQTAAASAAAASWRILLLPLDAAKTMMQVEGQHGLQHLWQKAKAGGPGVLYHGATASIAASFVGHYPWFTTYNTLNSWLPMPDTLHARLLRSAGIGFCAGVVSDAVSNSVRVVKNNRQTARHSTSYREVVKAIIAKDGVTGLFTRGLTTRIAANGLQNICFTVLWNLGQERIKHSKLLESLNHRQ